MEEAIVRVCLRTSVLLGFAMLVGFSLFADAQAPDTAVPDREALAAVVSELDAAWNARDALRFSAVFAEDGSFQFPVEGVALRGRDEIRQHYARQFAAFPPDLRHVTTAGESDVIGPGILAVDFEVAILGTDPTSGTSQVPVAHYRGLGVGVRTESGWHIRLARVYPVAR